MDSIFINRLREIVLANLSNEKFGVEDLAAEAGMSRINLYRKIRSSTNQDATHFIREIRLERAMELLLEHHYTAAEVGFMVGFGSPAYFSKCFHEYFGYPPGEVKKRDVHEMMNAGQSNTSVNRHYRFGSYFQKRKKTLIITGLVTLFITVLIASGYMVIRPRSEERMNETGHAEKSIAIVPFRNENPDPENDYVTSGVASEIYTHLHKVPGIRLKSLALIDQDWDKDKDLRSFCRKLGVDYFLGGSILKVGDSIRITVQLSEVNTGNLIWADSYDGSYNDHVLAFQSQVAMEVARSLDLALTGDEIKKIQHQSTRDILAWDLVLRGVYVIQMMKSTGETKNAQQAFNFFDRAIELDPQYSKVYYGKGWAYLMTFQLDSAMYYADKAIELDPDDYLGYKLKGTLFSPIDPGHAITYLNKAMEMEPDDYWTIETLGAGYCRYTNDVEKGLSLISKALILCNESLYSVKGRNEWPLNSPNQGPIYGDMARTLTDIGAYELAEKYFKKILAWGRGMIYVRDFCKLLVIMGKSDEALSLLDSLDNFKEYEMQCYFEKFRVYMMLGRYDVAERSITKGFSYGEELDYGNLPELALMYQKLGREEEALAILNKIKAQMDDRLSKRVISDVYFIYAEIFSILNEREKMLHYLSEAVKIGMGGGQTGFLMISPVFENFRGDPEFKALVKMAQEKIEIKRARVREMVAKGELAL